MIPPRATTVQSHTLRPIHIANAARRFLLFNFTRTEHEGGNMQPGAHACQAYFFKGGMAYRIHAQLLYFVPWFC